MSKVVVLMSTYNGEKFIEEQINSILNQKDVEMELVVRDDGSNDKTISILEKYAEKGLLTWYSGENLKPARSFLDLLKKCPDADYYSFSDQDDFWLENKLSNAVKALEKSKNKNGKMYFSATNIVDKNLNFIYKNEVNDNISFESAIIKNQATGCTIVIDENLRKLINKCEFDYIAMHDSWIYRIALINGSFVYYDNNSYIKYRQHENNVLGMTNNFFKLCKSRFNRFINSTSESSNTAKEILKNSAIINIGDKAVLEILSKYKNSFKYKLKLLFSKKCHSKFLAINILFKIKVLFNKA